MDGSVKQSLSVVLTIGLETKKNEVKALLQETPHILNWLCTYEDGFSTLLHKACEFGFSEIVSILLESPKGKEWIDVVNQSNGYTPLATSIKFGNMSLALLILQNGAAIDARTNKGDNLLHLLARMGMPENVVRAKLAMSLFSKLVASEKVDVDARNNKGKTALDICIDRKNPFLVKALVSAGASVGEREREADELLQSMTADQMKVLRHAQSMSPTPQEPEPQEARDRSLKNTVLSFFINTKETETKKLPSPVDTRSVSEMKPEKKYNFLDLFKRGNDEILIEDLHKITTKPFLEYRRASAGLSLSPPLHRKLRILAMDGGGVRCVMHCVFLEKICKAHPDFLDSIDMVCGTSGASVLAGLILIGTPVEKLAPLIQLCATSMLKDKKNGIIGPKYSFDLAKVALEELFGDLKVHELKSKYFAIPSFCLDNGNQIPGKRKWESVVMNNIEPKYAHLLFKDVVLRSSSAPSFFEQHQGYMDGGVFANNPSVCGLPLACGTTGLKLSMEDVTLLSLGTGEKPTPYLDRKTFEKAGLIQWMPYAMTCFQESQDEWTATQTKMFLGPGTFRMHPRLCEDIKLDEVANFPVLRSLADSIDITQMMQWVSTEWYGEAAADPPAN